MLLKQKQTVEIDLLGVKLVLPIVYVSLNCKTVVLTTKKMLLRL